MAGVRQKPPGLLAYQRGGRGRSLTVVARAERKPPPTPKGMSPHARKVWRDFFTDWVSDAVNYAADGERLRWWIHCVDEREKLEVIVVNAPLVKGSHGQLMLNPLHRRIDRLTRDIERAEEAFGMTPLSRFRLQLTATEAKRSANDLRREIMRDQQRSEDEMDEGLVVVDLQEPM